MTSGLQKIEYQAFENCTKLKNISLPDSLIKIGWSVFKGCEELTNIVIPNGIKEIETGTFAHCKKLNTVFIPKSVKYIDFSAFLGCTQLVNFNIDENNHSYKVVDKCVYTHTEKTLCFVFSVDQKEFFVKDSVLSISQSAFSNCHALKTVSLPYGIRRIGEHAFSGLLCLETVKVREGVSGLILLDDKENDEKSKERTPKIGAWAFYGCGRLTHVDIPTGINLIGEYAFGMCFNLREIYIPKNVTKIESNVFRGCSNLKIKVPDNCECQAGWCDILKVSVTMY